MAAVDWTPERTKTLIALWEEGLPTSEIGRRLDVTKNSVVGKVHRLGLKKRASPIRTSGAAKAKSGPKPAAKTAAKPAAKAATKAAAKSATKPATKPGKAKAAPVAAAIPSPIPAPIKVPMPTRSSKSEVVRLDTLNNSMCSWPEGEPGTPEFHFCGEPSLADKPYCAPHCARAYVKPSKERKDKSAA